MKRLLHTPTAMLLRRIALLYAVLMLCHVIFYLYNAQLLGPLSWGELGQLLAGSLKFDTASVVYADGIPDSIRSKCSMLYPVGLGLPFNHIVNIVIEITRCV